MGWAPRKDRGVWRLSRRGRKEALSENSENGVVLLHSQKVKFKTRFTQHNNTIPTYGWCICTQMVCQLSTHCTSCGERLRKPRKKRHHDKDRDQHP